MSNVTKRRKIEEECQTPELSSQDIMKLITDGKVTFQNPKNKNVYDSLYHF